MPNYLSFGIITIRQLEHAYKFGPVQGRRDKTNCCKIIVEWQEDIRCRIFGLWIDYHFYNLHLSFTHDNNSILAPKPFFYSHPTARWTTNSKKWRIQRIPTHSSITYEISPNKAKITVRINCQAKAKGNNGFLLTNKQISVLQFLFSWCSIHF